MKHGFLLIALIVGCATPFVNAQEGWEISLGAGLAQSPVYEGSEDYYVSPFPAVDVGYTTGSFSFSASILDGLGLSYMHPEGKLLTSISVAPGAGRDSDGYSLLFSQADHSKQTQELLEDTPTVRGIVSTDLTIGTITRVGLFAASVGYRPTDAEETYHAFVGSLVYMIGLPLTERLGLAASASIEAMDKRYAEAWYGLDNDTAALDAFEADAGLRMTQLAIEGTYMFSEQIGMTALVGESVLLGDAADSPYTESRFQTTGMLYGFYRF